MTCYNCDASIDGKDLAEVDQKAVEAKWCLGLMLSGQAYYSCPDCASGLFSPTRLYPVHTPKATPSAAPTDGKLGAGPAAG